jgi:S-adenosylmethionine:tRNA ribosyltransferase-isomerase
VSVHEAPVPRIDFALPPSLEADRPPEDRGLRRDEVRLLVARPRRLRHRRFRDLASELEPGDLVVVNISATLPSAVRGHRAGTARPAVLHVSTDLDDRRWVVEVRRPDNGGPDPDARPGDRWMLPGGVALTLEEPYPEAGVPTSRMWTATVDPATHTATYLPRFGRPVTYPYLRSAPPPAAYQTAFADVAGSAEMPSAGRPFTPELVVRLIVRGVAVAPIVLHTGLSSAEAGEPPAPERYVVPAATARLVDATVATGGRVVAVGTTVVRALETCADADGRLRPGRGWTDLVVGGARPTRVVSGLITGWHAPRATHLALLEAVAGPELVRAAYERALGEGYLWHEFGDSALFLP